MTDTHWKMLMIILAIIAALVIGKWRMEYDIGVAEEGYRRAIQKERGR